MQFETPPRGLGASADSSTDSGFTTATTSDPASDWAHCLLAPNPSPHTLTGTNTWVLNPAGGSDAMVIDPGPLIEEHHSAIRAFLHKHGLRVSQVLLTHRHDDHAGGARQFAESINASVHALDPAHSWRSETLVDGQILTLNDVPLQVVATPGHTSDSLSLLVMGTLFTGDTVLGGSSTMVTHPDGRLGDYLDSLERIAELCREAELQRLLPGHGYAMSDPLNEVRRYQVHRQQRLDQVREAVASGARTPEEVVAVVYAETPKNLWPAAELSVRAQMQFLQEDGRPQ